MGQETRDHIMIQGHSLARSLHSIELPRCCDTKITKEFSAFSRESTGKKLTLIRNPSIPARIRNIEMYEEK
jgi:hypothetical protein